MPIKGEKASGNTSSHSAKGVVKIKMKRNERKKTTTETKNFSHFTSGISSLNNKTYRT
jgi:hypothetical protein